jgi:predicted enzyme related to lactoylglutathione lyase
MACDKTEDKGLTVWHVAERDSAWFNPNESSFMMNYRVDDLWGMIANLEKAGVKILPGPELPENGTFAWIMDPDGNKAGSRKSGMIETRDNRAPRA